MTPESNTPQNPANTAAEQTEFSSHADVRSPTVTTSKTPRQIMSSALLQGDREIQIVHGEEVYRLSLTRQGKLILHK